MRPAAKFFLILGIISGALMIFPLVLGIIALNKLNDENTTKEDLITWAILSSLFVNPIAGIFMFLLSDTVEQKATYANLGDEQSWEYPSNYDVDDFMSTATASNENDDFIMSELFE